MRNSVGAVMVALVLTVVAPSRAEAYEPEKNVLTPGRLEAGLVLAGVWQSTATTPDGGEEVTGSSLYTNPALFFGYTVIQNLQVRLNVGYQIVRLTSGDVTLQNNGSVVTGLTAVYHFPIGDMFSFYGSLGGGGFFGQTTREAGVAGVKYESSTNGAMGQFGLGLLGQTGKTLTLRAGIRFDMLFGSETPVETLELPDQSFTNLQALLEFQLGFRFAGP